MQPWLVCRVLDHTYLPVDFTIFAPMKLLDTRRGTKCNHSPSDVPHFWGETWPSPDCEPDSQLYFHMQIDLSFFTMSLYSLISNVNPGTNNALKIYLNMEHFCLTLLPNLKYHKLLRCLPGGNDAVCLIWDMAWSLENGDQSSSQIYKNRSFSWSWFFIISHVRSISLVIYSLHNTKPPWFYSFLESQQIDFSFRLLSTSSPRQFWIPAWYLCNWRESQGWYGGRIKMTAKSMFSTSSERTFVRRTNSLKIQRCRNVILLSCLHIDHRFSLF